MAALPAALPGNNDARDTDDQETREWLDALSAVIDAVGKVRADFLLDPLVEAARQHGVDRRCAATTGSGTTRRRSKTSRAQNSGSSGGVKCSSF